MAVMAALAGRTPPPALRHERRCRWRCAIRCFWPSSAPPSTCCRKAACCRVSASASRWGPSGRRSTSTPRHAAGAPTNRCRSSPGCGARTASTSRASTIALKAARRSRPSRCSPTCRCGSAARRTPRSGARRATGTGWQSGAETAGRRRQGHCRHQEGGGRGRPHDRRGSLRRCLPVLFRQPEGDGVSVGAMAAYQKRTGRDPSGYFAIGDAKVILDRVARMRGAVGVEKFILQPVGPDGDAIDRPDQEARSTRCCRWS